MFAKKISIDIKKSTLKIQDYKRDSATRLKHVKIVIDNVETAVAKSFFEANFSHIYSILYESFLAAETNLKQKIQKTHKEELDLVLSVLEKILILLPELLSKRWQCYSLTRIMLKLLHHDNTWRVRKEGIRLFLLWYQAIGENSPDILHAIFATLVPGFPTPKLGDRFSALCNDTPYTMFLDGIEEQASAAKIQPVLMSQSIEKHLDERMQSVLDTLLELMVSQVTRIEWRDRYSHQHQCFSFLLEMFKKFYLPHIFPNFLYSTSLYKVNLDFPETRKQKSTLIDTPNGKKQDPFVACRVNVIKWVSHFAQASKKDSLTGNTLYATSDDGMPDFRRASVMSQGPDSSLQEHRGSDADSFYGDGDGGSNSIALFLCREVLYGSRENVNFVHEVYRQAFLLNFTHSSAVRKALAIYKDWIQMTAPDIPPFILEPVEPGRGRLPSCESSSMEVDGGRDSRMDSHSSLPEDVLVQAGLQNVLLIFMTNAANLFLLEVGQDYPSLLEEQVDACKRVLNIYRYMVMRTKMETKTWEQLLLTLLKITSQVITKIPPKRKDDTLGGKLAQALFQTLIVTWIKANLNVVVSNELWDHFYQVLSSLTQWEELIREWAKTLDTLTRVMARQVYKLDLDDLPLDRMKDQKVKRRPHVTIPQQPNSNMQDLGRLSARSPKHAFADNTSLPSSSVCGADGNEFAKVKVSGVCQLLRKNRGLRRSFSDSYLVANKICSAQLVKESIFRFPEQEIEHIKRSSCTKRSYSLDSISLPKDNSLVYPGSETPTRTPSPSPSSGVGASLVKDSIMQMDNISADGNSYDPSSNSEHRSVMAGGNLRGWCPEVVVVLWRRMLGALGDVNRLVHPNLHVQVFEYLIELSKTLLKINANHNLVLEPNSPSPSSELTPPFLVIIPWCFKALVLPNDYNRGKVCAYELLCDLILSCQDINLPKDNVIEFYRVLHLGLTGTHQPVINALVRHCGTRFFSLMLPGHTLLMLDFIQASNTVIGSNDIRGVPRTEAMSIIGALLSLSSIVENAVLNPNSTEYSLITSSDTKDYIFSLLLRFGKMEQSGRARCIALSCIGIFLCEELRQGNSHPKMRDAISILLMSLRCNHKTIVKVAIENLLLLADNTDALLKVHPDVSLLIVETIVHTIHSLLTTPMFEDEGRLLVSLIFCVGEWCMRLPIYLLMKSFAGSCLLLNVFRVLNSILAKNQTHVSLPPLDSDFDPNIKFDDLKERPWQGGRGSLLPSNNQNNFNENAINSLKLAAKAVLTHLLRHLDHFPMAARAARLSSLAEENDDVPGLNTSKLNTQVFSEPNVQLFAVNNKIIMSMIELPAPEPTIGGVTFGLCAAPFQVRLILRDRGWKTCWDASLLYCNEEDKAQCTTPAPNFSKDLEYINSISSFIVEQNAASMHKLIRRKPPNILPNFENAEDDMDSLDDLLQYIGHTSSECLKALDTPRNVAAQFAPPLNPRVEVEAIASIVSQKKNEKEFIGCNREQEHQYLMASKCHPDTPGTPTLSFLLCKLLFSHFGYTGWERRSHINLLRKDEKFIREIRNLDAKICRETHKIAVFYVADGQEDKNSILSNTSGSAAYEEFVAGLAWEVELESHTGFMGGLQKNKSTGDTAPFYATSFVEVMFHGATRMPSSSQESLLQKTRHLGNDEVHIVWSENSSDYWRGIIPTEFCDILMVIYPLPNRLYRVQVNRKKDVPYFGPLFNESIVGHQALPMLVRATAIAASRAKRSMLPMYQTYYEERTKALLTIADHYKIPSTFEEFASSVYAPVYLVKSTASMFSNNETSHAGESAAHHIIGSVMRSNSTLSANSLSGSTTSTVTLDTVTLMSDHHSYGAEDELHDIALSESSGPPTMSFSKDLD
ncbi:ral GTPase-activating protein subunit alpha-1 isoform X2 [Neocloeon triangulifer]|uniref:ral GTPase-activating protein subunit alpha-1 isoform X2 n=1 Tax=Neocloeon triangulifer TaxID=2078957 RepID=UPI00286F8B96|nr:ral GTPase-activating protein subunit alpha-1 isoform X2 [Neocloeon triangulifer]